MKKGFKDSKDFKTIQNILAEDHLEEEKNQERGERREKKEEEGQGECEASVRNS